MSNGIQIEFSRNAMACSFQVVLNSGQPIHGPDLAIRALDKIDDLEAKLSVYRATSEFSVINREARRGPLMVSEPVFRLLELAKQYHQQTGGAFDLTAASLSEAWGFSRRNGRVPNAEEIQRALEACGTDAIQLDAEQRSVRFSKPELKINSGGIGKGFAIDRAADILRAGKVEHFLIHGGKSSILASGSPSDSRDASDQGWAITVRHPVRNQVQLGTLRLRNQALGTSGAANQFFYFQGVRYGHVIDPRTGWPVGTGPQRKESEEVWLSVTVVDESAAAADALATGLYVLGPSATEEFCAKHPDVGFLGILPGKREGETLVVRHNSQRFSWTPT